jgi:pimeloyl-ACP methyl ester carboxylesterase
LKRAFVLSHGGRHGSWSWKFVVGELEERGHQAKAIDLPLEDPTAGAERFAEVIAEAAGGLPQPVTIVGHSMSGLVIPLVPNLVPVDELAFVCAPLPVPGLALWDQLTSEENGDLLIRSSLQPMLDASAAGDTIGVTEAHAIATYYHDLPASLALWAARQLRPQLAKVTSEPSPFSRWPEVHFRYVLGRNDRIVNPDWARREVPRRLGVTPIELDTGHSPFLARPRELVDALLMPRPAG